MGEEERGGWEEHPPPLEAAPPATPSCWMDVKCRNLKIENDFRI